MARRIFSLVTAGSWSSFAKFQKKGPQSIALQLLLNRNYGSAGSADSTSASYRHGFVVLSIPLPSRAELCEFNLKPITHSVKDFMQFIKDEDGGVERAAVYSNEGARISHSTPIEILMQNDFKLIINEKSYDVVPPKERILEDEHTEHLSQLRNLIERLHTELHIKQYQEQREQQIKQRLEHLHVELEPLEAAKTVLDSKAGKTTNVFVWGGLAYMAVQFGFLARLTWWEYSWDIMEPVTYFVTYGSSILMYAYFVLTREEYTYPFARDREHLKKFHKEAEKGKFNLAKYNGIKDSIARLQAEKQYLNNPQFKLPAKSETAES